MSEAAPTLDRLFAGLMAGAAVGAVLVTVSITVIFSAVGVDAWWFVSTALLLFLLLAMAMPVVQAPLWLLMRALRMSDWIAATIAGGLAFATPIVLFAIAWADYAGPPPSAQTVVLLVSWIVAGLAAGFVAWRVARFGV